MSAWQRAAGDDRCGGCGVEIVKGASVLVLQPREMRRRLYRCERCAGPAPPNLPDRIETSEAPVSLERLGLLPLTFGRR